MFVIGLSDENTSLCKAFEKKSHFIGGSGKIKSVAIPSIAGDVLKIGLSSLKHL